MLKHFAALLKKDIKLIIHHKFILIMLGSLLVYSLYINFVYLVEGTKTVETNLYLLFAGQQQQSFATDQRIKIVGSAEELYQTLAADQDGVGIRLDQDGHPDRILLYQVSPKIDRSKALAGLNLLLDDEHLGEVPLTYLGKGDLEQKQRVNMTAVIIFFEIAAISFLGIAAIFFKEKAMGVIKVYGVLPGSKFLYLASKVLLFLGLEIIFAVGMCLINLGVEYTRSILAQVILQVVLLSPIMVLLGFLFSLVYHDLKQFILAYTIIVVLGTSPVFLFVTSPLEWTGLYLLPSYYAFSALYNAMLKQPYPVVIYGLACIVVMLGLSRANYYLMKREIERG